MRKSSLASILVPACLAATLSFAAVPRFEKISDHCYYFQSKGDMANVAAVVSDDGVLLIDPPGGSDPVDVLDAIRRLTPRPVRWVVNTDYRLGRSGGAERFVEQGALLLGSRQIYELGATTQPGPQESPQQELKAARPADSAARLVFEQQMRLFPGGVEVRIVAVRYKAHTGGDVVAFVPAEKVLFVGDLYVAGSYPDIDVTPGNGSALGWLDGMKQVIDAVPLLKAAIPQKIEVKPGEEKTLEELVTVISARGPRSNLQEMKDLLDIARKLRTEAARSVSGGRDIDSFLASPNLAPYRSYENLVPFARQLFDELAKK